jgi:hypothetical protein
VALFANPTSAAPWPLFIARMMPPVPLSEPIVCEPDIKPIA